jgi:Ciliary BBSome complex subunit 2, C-terminal
MQLFVFELTQAVPKFAACARLPDSSSSSSSDAPRGTVSFTVPEQLSRIALWLNEAFLMGEGGQLKCGRGETGGSLKVKFLALALATVPPAETVPEELWISAESSQEGGVRVQVRRCIVVLFAC